MHNILSFWYLVMAMMGCLVIAWYNAPLWLIGLAVAGTLGALLVEQLTREEDPPCDPHGTGSPTSSED